MKKIFACFCIISLVLVGLSIKYSSDNLTDDAILDNSLQEPSQNTPSKPIKDVAGYISRFKQLDSYLKGMPYVALLADTK